MDATSRDRRGEDRLAVGIAVALTFRDGHARWTEVDSAVLDISRRGMFVLSDRVPIDYQQIVLRIASKSRGLCAASGRPVRIDESGGFGVRFERINRGFHGLIHDLQALAPAELDRTLSDLTDVQIWIERG